MLKGLLISAVALSSLAAAACGSSSSEEPSPVPTNTPAAGIATPIPTPVTTPTGPAATPTPTLSLREQIDTHWVLEANTEYAENLIAAFDGDEQEARALLLKMEGITGHFGRRESARLLREMLDSDDMQKVKSDVEYYITHDFVTISVVPDRAAPEPSGHSADGTAFNPGQVDLSVPAFLNGIAEMPGAMTLSGVVHIRVSGDTPRQSLTRDSNTVYYRDKAIITWGDGDSIFIDYGFWIEPVTGPAVDLLPVINPPPVAGS